MENGLVRTDKLSYKIRRFFLNLFIKKNSEKAEEIETFEEVMNNTELELDKVTSYKTEIQEVGIKQELARKLMKNELEIDNLTEEEIEEMIEYFKNDIESKNVELESVKKELAELMNN